MSFALPLTPFTAFPAVTATFRTTLPHTGWMRRSDSSTLIQRRFFFHKTTANTLRVFTVCLVSCWAMQDIRALISVTCLIIRITLKISTTASGMKVTSIKRVTAIISASSARCRKPFKPLCSSDMIHWAAQAIIQRVTRR